VTGWSATLVRALTVTGGLALVEADGSFVTVRQADARSPSTGITAPAVSGDGRFVAFESFARLVDADTDDLDDIYVLDRRLGLVTIETSTRPTGTPHIEAGRPRISRDGRFLVYECRQKLPDDSASTALVMFRDRRTGEVRGIGPRGGSSNGPSREPDISADGHVVVFASAATNLIDGPDANGDGEDVYSYDPTSGAILVDGQPLARIPAEPWRERLAGAFQDFVRFEFTAQHSVGLGDLSRLDVEPAVVAAVARAGATDVMEKLPSGLGTQLGPTWPGGVDVSFGQWQKLALARGFMRDEPLLLILDEPTAALDAETEHALFERYAQAARGPDAHGRITVLVSHRFSTVRMADFIVVLDGSRVVESGSHEQLMARQGRYAELYRIQARSYQ